MSAGRRREFADWGRLAAVSGVGELPFPWPVGGFQRLGLHASSRRFYRLCPAREAGVGDPRTLVLVLYENDDAEGVERYRRCAGWLAHAGVRVPRVYGSSARALLVEDGGDDLLSDAPDDAGLAARYGEAAAIVLALQRRGMAAPDPNPDMRLDGERLRRELDFTEEHALRGWLDAEPSERRARMFDRVVAAVRRQPLRLCHRDYHSRNLMCGEQLLVLDFQDAMQGPLFYDLASLLHDDYRDVPAPAAAQALRVFWRGAAQEIALAPEAEVPAEPRLLPAAARQAFACAAAQRSLKALGTFGYQVSVAGKREYASCARHTWGHARRTLASLGWDDLIDELAAFDRL